MPLGMLSDERLARMVGEGNERAFSVLYSRFHQQLYRYCHSMVRHDADAQDALQSTFTSALDALRKGQRDAPLKPWLYRIAHNESISLLRRRRALSEVPETLEAPGLSVEGTAEERARLALLVADLQALPERQRGVLVMRELSGLSHEEVAQSLGISVGAAKQTVFEARQALADFAEGRAMACEEIQRVVSDGDGRALRGRRVRAHLRDCSRCQSFARAIPERRAALLALSPALPAAAASGLLGKITGATGAHHGGGGLLASVGGKSVGVALSAKTVATVAVVATATVGAVGAIEVATHAGHHHVVPTQLLKSGESRGSAAIGAASGNAAAAGGLGHSGNAGAAGRGAATTHGQHGARFAVGNAVGSHVQGAGRSGPAGQSGSSSSTITTGGPSNAGATGQGSGSSSGNPNAHGGNPNAGAGTGGGSSNAGGTNPNAHGGNPNAGGGNGGGSSNAHGGNPNAGGGSTNAHGGNPNAGGGSTNAHGGNPNAGGGNSHGNGGVTTTTTPTVTTTPTTGSSNAHGGNPHAHHH